MGQGWSSELRSSKIFLSKIILSEKRLSEITFHETNLVQNYLLEMIIDQNCSSFRLVIVIVKTLIDQNS